MRKVKYRNGIRHPLSTRIRVRELRRRGLTHREIVKILQISLGSASLWTKGIRLSPEQKKAVWKRYSKKVFTPERRKQLSVFAQQTGYLREKYSRESLLKKILDFYGEHGRIPLKREFNMHHEYKSRFGSWNNAIQAAGFSPNPVAFSYKFTARDGHPCDSFTEKIIDDWLFNRGIAHERNWRYGTTKLTADFKIEPNTLIEFFGLAGVQKVYDEFIKRKRLLAQKLSLKLVEVYPRDIFPQNRLSELL